MELSHKASRAGRLSSFLLGELAMSAGLMNKLKWGDSIQVDGIPQHTNYPVQPGQIITVRMEEPLPDYPAEPMTLQILYEDDHLLAIDKPSGMLIHPSRSCNTGTVANQVLGHYLATGQQCAFHPVTRLDRDTYGLTLIAKTAHAHALLQTGKVQKTYHGLVYGHPAEAAGRIDAPIARKPLPSLLREIRPDGKPSITEYRLLNTFSETSLLELTPVTGRTHQLRLHCAYMGVPILGDPQYGTPESLAYSAGLHITGQRLCAKRLALTHPITGMSLTLASKMDACFLQDRL